MQLILKNLSLSYKSNLVLENINHIFEQGQIHALLGPNGSGKSTLIKAVSGVKEIDSGNISLLPRQSNKNNLISIDALSPKERARLIAVVPQNSFLGGALSVKDVITLGRTPYLSFTGNLSEKDHKSVLNAIERFELTEFINTPISYLSGGEQQRVLLARAIVQDTPVLLLDEPTNHLDLKYQNELFQWLEQIKNTTDKLIIIAMHDLNLASIYTDQIILLKNKKIYAHGNSQETLSKENISNIYDTKIKIFNSNGKNIILPDH